MNPNGVTPADGDAKEYHLDPPTLKKIKEDLHNLIFRHSKVYDLTDSKQELYLAGEPSPIQYNKTDATDAERFIGLVEKYGVYLKQLITHLDYDSETGFVESKSIVGNIDIDQIECDFINGFTFKECQYKINDTIIFSAGKIYLDPDLSKITFGKAAISKLIVENLYFHTDYLLKSKMNHKISNPIPIHKTIKSGRSGTEVRQERGELTRERHDRKN